MQTNIRCHKSCLKIRYDVMDIPAVIHTSFYMFKVLVENTVLSNFLLSNMSLIIPAYCSYRARGDSG